MRIAIIGLGLMGGSLAVACRKKFLRARIIGISRNQRALKFALRKGWIHEAFTEFPPHPHPLPANGERGKQKQKFLSTYSRRKNKKFPLAPVGGEGQGEGIDLIILCTPVDSLKNFLLKIDRFARPGTLVTDVGSVKGRIVRWASAHRFKNIQFVGAHPMAGSHVRGIESASASLYDKSFVFVTPSQKNSAKAVANIESFWKKIASKVIRIRPQQHDVIVAEVSHLPHLAAACLVLAPKKKSLPFAASGFFDTTRVAQGHPSIWVPIFLENRKAIQAALSAFEKRLGRFHKALKNQDEKTLERLLAQAFRTRSNFPLKS